MSLTRKRLLVDIFLTRTLSKTLASASLRALVSSTATFGREKKLIKLSQ